MATFYVSSLWDRSQWITVDTENPARAAEAALRDLWCRDKPVVDVLLVAQEKRARTTGRVYLCVPRRRSDIFGRWVVIGEVVPGLLVATDLPAGAKYQPGHPPDTQE